MLFVSQLVSFRLIFLTQNLLVFGWTNEQGKYLLSFCFENQIDIHSFSKCSMTWSYATLSIIFDNIVSNETGR